jgi:hypothetical protein
MRSNAYLPASKVGKFPQNAIDAKSRAGLYLGTGPRAEPRKSQGNRLGNEIPATLLPSVQAYTQGSREGQEDRETGQSGG